MAIVLQAAADFRSGVNQFEHLSFLNELKPSPTAPAHSAARSRGRSSLIATAPLDSETAMFYKALCARWGICPQRYRTSILQRRKSATLRALRVSSLDKGLEIINRDEQAAARALGAVMIGVTGFFRDQSVFAGLLPLLTEIVEQARRPRIVSLGCSDGSELYSVAMLLAVVRGLDQARLLGVDCRPSAIAAARAGVYAEEAVAELPQPLRDRFISPLCDASLQTAPARRRVCVGESIRRACHWKVADVFDELSGDSEGATVILCRNLAIYLTPEAATQLWHGVTRRLVAGGLLVVGKAERPPASLRGHLHRVCRCIYQRTDLELSP